MFLLKQAINLYSLIFTQKLLLHKVLFVERFISKKPKLIYDMGMSEKIKTEIIFKSNNRCCICQTPFIQIHHIDSNRENNEFDNLIPLCPNCHSQAHSKNKLTLELSPIRIKEIRDKWYLYCENRKLMYIINPNAILKLKLFIREMPFPTYSWKKTFSSLHPSYVELNKEEIAERIFATSNPDDLKTYLTAVYGMYQRSLHKRDKEGYHNIIKFKELCNTFGFDFDINNKEIIIN